MSLAVFGGIVGLGLPALYVALPALADLGAIVRVALGRRKRFTSDVPPEIPPNLLFIVPAHDEELLIARCLASIAAQRYAKERFATVVVADDCTDATADIARAAGVGVLERTPGSGDERGKQHAIGWVLPRIAPGFDAVIIVDADSVLDPDFARAISRIPDLRKVAAQAYDGLSNEFDSALTTLAGLFTRMRYQVVMPLKRRAGLAVPLTGNGSIIGAEVLGRLGWNPRTTTEGWELYAQYTLAEIPCVYAPGALILAQEAKHLAQSRSQRRRWTTGRFAVLSRAWKSILKSSVPALQKIDLLAELSSFGPVTRGALGLGGAGISTFVPGWAGVGLVLLFLSGVLQPAVYAAAVMRAHPAPLRVARALLYLPIYAAWRIGLSLGILVRKRPDGWNRTTRHAELPPNG